MHFYRSLSPIKALTFDLDDTLYDNAPFLEKAIDKMMDALRQVDGLQQIKLVEFNQVKQDLLIDKPEIYHDVLTWRAESIRRFLHLKGINKQQHINQITDQAMDTFVFWRNKVVVPKQSLATLAALAEKFPLAVITNGNADITKIGLTPYFKFALRGGANGPSKPFPDIFNLAADKLALPSENILHVGDNLHADVQGAINSGMQACWLNVLGTDIYQQSEATVLPHIEIKQLSELNSLL